MLIKLKFPSKKYIQKNSNIYLLKTKKAAYSGSFSRFIVVVRVLIFIQI